MNERMRGWMKEWMNTERINETKNRLMNEWMNNMLPTFLSIIGLTNLGLSSTLRVIFVVIAPARFVAVHVYSPISAG